MSWSLALTLASVSSLETSRATGARLGFGMTTKTFVLFVFSFSYALGGFAFEMAKTAAGLPIRLDSAR
jgi:hypothetical protein